MKCITCGLDQACKTMPEVLPKRISANTIGGLYLRDAYLTDDGWYYGSRGSTLDGLIVDPRDIDWDEYRRTHG